MVEAKHFKRVLAAVDDSKLGQLALVNAIHQAQEDDSELTIVSVFEAEQMNVFDYFSKEKNAAAREDVEEALKRYRQTAVDAGVGHVGTVFAEGEPGEVIVKDVIPSVKPDMVVIGSHSQRGAEKYFGSQSSYVANNAPVTVMIVR
ncbi:universal stress protein [Weissella cibaria]|uniref:universal stress protein n=1 Tax=Weissella cibaria TaxID=137591 RepID=UPI00223A78CF|nr:universal stress protein [Weissella cibaria]MCT0955657.1 universal stress protein [Weissella cibaria]